MQQAYVSAPWVYIQCGCHIVYRRSHNTSPRIKDFASSRCGPIAGVGQANNRCGPIAGVVKWQGPLCPSKTGDMRLPRKPKKWVWGSGVGGPEL